MHAIVEATEADVYQFASRRTSDAAAASLYVASANASTGAYVARDDGVPVAIAFARELNDARYITELYVEPSFRRGGIGGELYRTLMSDDRDRDRCGVADARDVQTVAFCARIGLPMRALIYRAAGTLPEAEELARLAAGDYRFAIEPLDPARHAYAVDALDRETLATARPAVHAMLAARAAGSAFFLNDECVGYVYVAGDGRIGPMACASPSYALQMLAFAMITLQEGFGASWCSAFVPGVNARVLRRLVRFGLKLEGPWTYGSDSTGGDLARYVGYHPLLF